MQREKEFGVKFISTISKTADHIIGFIFIGNMGLDKSNLRSCIDSFNKVVERIKNL